MAGAAVGEMAPVRAFAILFFDGFKLFLSLAITVLRSESRSRSRFLEEQWWRLSRERSDGLLVEAAHEEWSAEGKHSDGDRVGGSSSRRNQFEGGFNMLDFMLKRSHLFGFEWDLPSERLVMVLAMTSSWQYGQRGVNSINTALFAYDQPPLLPFSLRLNFSRKKTRYVAENLSHNGSGKVFRARGTS